MTDKPTLAITEYQPIAAALTSIEKYRGLVVDVKTEQGLREAKAVLREVAAPRIALEKARTKLKADVLERGRLIDGEAKRIAAQFAAIEDPIKAQVDAEERRIEAAREAAIKAEQDRLAAEERARKEAEERRLAEDRRKLEQERAKFEAEQRAARERAEAEERQRRAKLDEEERAARARRDEEDRKAREARHAEEDRLRAERAKIDAERRAKEEAERKERDAREAEERERCRQEEERLGARRMLEAFVQRFGHVEQLTPVVNAVKQLLPLLDQILKKAA